MTTKEIAAKLKELCDRGDFKGALNELFSADAVSIEPEAGGGFEKETKGLPAIHKKGEQWTAMVEAFHGITISEPLIAGNSFALAMSIDATMKGRPRGTMNELCIYKVKDGKIISEEFVM
jgi:hypothetical protein